MVIVSMAFIGIIVGALLTAAGYAYRLRMQDVNARDNFYYVEQAMNEIYAGVGSETLENMQDAYVYTVENMVRFDVPTQTYVKISDEEAEKMFKDRFMHNLESNTYFQAANIANSLKKYITDPSVKLDESRLTVEKVNVDGKLDKIIVKNVTLTRTVNYKKAVGDYTQTISADIEIGNPDFDVLFNSTSGGSPNIFTFSMVADMGIEIDSKMPVTIVGNIYAAADYYNKNYDASAYDGDVNDADRKFTKTYKDSANKDVKIEYTHGSVTSRKYDSDSPALNTFYNFQSTIMNSVDNADPTKRQFFDGVNKRSMYSGLFVDGTNVSILADMVIVPGSISVMDTGFLSIYGKNGAVVDETEVWADNVILGGYSIKVPTTKKDEDGNTVYDYTGSKATFRANLYVKDDTEINATASEFSLRGKYYGYGDSTSKDARTFLPTVNKEDFQTGFVQYDSNGNVIKDSNGNPVIKMENRGHYNSSAFIVNGERSTINLKDTKAIFLAGRSYIELSKDVTNTDVEVKDKDGNTSTMINMQTVEFSPTANNFSTTTNLTDTVYLRDYKTGESLSLKSNQVAYIPVQYTGIPTEAVERDGKTHLEDDDYGNTQYDANLHTALIGSALFEKYFPEARFREEGDNANRKYAIPCIMQEVSGKKYYYYDFERAYGYIADGSLKYAGTEENRDSTAVSTLGAAYCDKFVADYPTAEAYAASFITDYVAELNNPNSTIKDYLADITDYEGFTAGDIILPKTDSYIYSSGAITSKEGTKFNIAVDNADNLNALFSGGSFTVTGTDIMSYSDDLEKEYNYVKWNLGHYDATDNLEEKYIDDLVNDDNYTEASITPINKFLNFDKIGDGEKKLSLSSGYYVVYSGDTVTVNEEGIVKGIIITKGDVVFKNTVTGFEGLIVSGGKIYISNDMQTINASAEICRAILRECQLSGDLDCKNFLDLFKGFEGSEIIEDNNSTEAKTIDTIDYSDVVRFNNWMKNVE